MSRPSPMVAFVSEELSTLAPQIASLPASVFKTPIGTLEHTRDEMVAALDFAIVGF
ncbi:MAG: CcdB-like toxin protein [Gammaproteobacteria bacterium]|nr:CcdB-like toxin protein [Gammaproteobacteria bacterium]